MEEQKNNNQDMKDRSIEAREFGVDDTQDVDQSLEMKKSQTEGVEERKRENFAAFESNEPGKWVQENSDGNLKSTVPPPLSKQSMEMYFGDQNDKK